MLKIPRVDSDFWLQHQNGLMDFHNFYTIRVIIIIIK